MECGGFVVKHVAVIVIHKHIFLRNVICYVTIFGINQIIYRISSFFRVHPFSAMFAKVYQSREKNAIA